MARPSAARVLWLDELDPDDTNRVGGKNASLAEMTRAPKDRGVRVPDGFAIATDAYRAFLANDLEGRLRDRLARLENGVPQIAEKAVPVRRDHSVACHKRRHRVARGQTGPAAVSDGQTPHPI